MAIQVAIEGYDSLEQIGVGGMAAVYRARKISIDKTVAIKVLFPYLATDETYIDRFQREARAAASIQHENVVNVIDFGESDGAFFIVMEYYDGRTLEQLMRDRPALPHDIAVQILLEVAFGLEAAHAVDVVHRDIKPANIIFTNQGGVKIADFGLARKSDSATLITQHGKVIGTPAYMSPEQAAGRPVGPAGDIFSLGVVAYELLGRCKPFEGKSYSDVLEKIQTFDPQPLSTINPLVPPEFERIVHRMLEKEESARIATAGELIAEFEAAMAHNGITRDRRQLALYARDPEPYDAAFVEKTVAGCLTRADEFLRQGASGADAAMLEFRRILTLDPEHERARAELDRLRNEYSHTQHTVTMDAVRPATTARSSSARRSIGVRTLPRWAYALAAVVAVVLAAVVFHPASRPAGDSQPGVSMGAGKQDSAFLAHAVTGADSSRSSRTSAHRDSTRTTGTERRTM
ncbi:MAG TPA: serine/threonine-protein kinase, partial [Candidatus Krumholzibacteria bacterium]|nr:serine/threonine-protein kinase [Candidatus Krumholzibacteria bacterium]